MAKLFISYSRVNLEVVEKLRDDLQNAGVDVWIDQVGLTPGTPDWDQALRDAIQQASAVLLVASPDSRRSPYVRDEIAIAKDAKKPIYPLWVDGDSWIDSIPMGLGSTQNVDLRGESYPENLQRLIASLGGNVSDISEPIAPIQAEDKPQIPPPADPRNPYKGLRAFTSDDSDDFFGRDTLVEDFLNIVADDTRSARVLAVLGASGSGKSSVMMAGLLPQLKQNHPDWTFLDPIVPGTNPLEKLTIMLARQFDNKSQTAIEDDLKNRNTRGLHRLASELSDKPLVLYIDQFEEVFTLVDKEADRRHFIDILTTAVTEPDGTLYLLLSMRADFYDRPLQYNAFGKLIENHHVAVTPMTLADLYDVVQGPAQLPDVGVTFEDGLVTEMVFAVREETAALPLLQFTLDQLFEARDGHTLTMQAYHDLGGIQGALAKHADATYNNLSSDQHRQLARALFLRLIEPGKTEQDTTRRRVTDSELTLPDVEQTRILQDTTDKFVNARLLVTDQSGNDRTIEVSHEKLIREWARLREWLKDARDDLRMQKKINSDATDWVKSGKPKDYGGFYAGTLLVNAENWMQHNLATEYETDFIQASKEQQLSILTTEEARRLQLQEAATEAREQAELAHRNSELADRRERTSKNVLIITFVFIMIALVTGFVAFQQRIIAEEVQNEVSTQMAELEPIMTQYTSIATQGALWSEVSTANELISADRLPVERSFSGVPMVIVPTGCFVMGSNNDAEDESPIHVQCVDHLFWIDKFEVTNEQFNRLGGNAVSSGDWEKPNHPRTSVTWFEANDYCKQRDARLPTELEWEYAARGIHSLIYPWGNEWNEDNLVWIGNSENQAQEIGNLIPESASWVGAYDMSGNVWEWVSTIYDQIQYPYPYSFNDGRENEYHQTSERVIRGGSWRSSSDPERFRLSDREGKSPLLQNSDIGFRCVRS